MRTGQIYRKIAKKNGVSVKEVKTEMQAAINNAYKNPPNDGGVTAAYQQKVPCKGEIPTPEELIRYIAGEIKKNGLH